MSDPYIKAIPDPEEGKLHFVMDRDGFEQFQRLLTRTQPAKSDNQLNFNAIKDRISGAFLAGAVQMGWRGKRG